MLPSSLQIEFEQIWESYVKEAGELLGRIEEILGQCLQSEPARREMLWLELRRALHTLKGAASAAGDTGVQAAAHALEDRIGIKPTDNPQEIEELLDAGAKLRPTLTSQKSLNSDEDLDPLKGTLPTADKSEETPIQTGQHEYLRMRPERIDALHTLSGELVVTRLQQTALTERLLMLREKAEESQRLFHSFEHHFERVQAHTGMAIREEFGESRRNMQDMLAEIGREIESLSRELPLVNEQAAMVSASLEEGIRELRLMPLQPFFREYAQVVRTAAKECGKRATLIVRAEGAEIDRTILLRLREPLLHMVRNAVVHGLELPEQRLRRGKAETGQVLLEAHTEGTRIIIRVSDDGGGIDMAAVRKRARALHLVEPGRELTSDALLDLLCYPGFSTQEQTDGLAGRGIGLDVARATIFSLSGQLSLDNLPGAGCIFTLEVPVTTSTNSGLLLRVHDELYGVLLSQIDRVLRIATEDLESCEGRTIFKLQGSPIAAVPLAELLGLPPSPVQSPRRPAVVLRVGKQRMVLIVDDVPGEQAMVIKPLGRAFAGSRLFIGGAIQPDHTIVPVLQVPALFDRAGEKAIRPGPYSLKPARSRGSATILVVDDSMTLRTLLRNILRAAGYKVALAHDGQAALEELARLPHCNLLITDLQMPKMDGAALCRAVRASPRAQLPILIVTSVGENAEKQQAMAAGADAYIVKSEFEQDQFLKLVAQLLGRNA